MLDGVGDRLTRDEVGSGLDLGRHAPVQIRVELDWERGPVGQRLERHRQSLLRQDGRMHAPGQLAQLVDGDLKLVDRRREDMFELRLEILAELALGGDAKLKRQRDEALQAPS